MKKVVTIAGSDSSGGAGIQADIKTMTVNGVYAMSVITAMTAQNTTGVRAVQEATPVFLKEQLDEVLDTLTEREQKVLRLRFGMNDGRARTLEEVGREFDVTRERIRQIEAKALRKLRHPSRSRKLRDYLD